MISESGEGTIDRLEPGVRRAIFVSLVLFGLILFGIRLSGDPDFTDNEWRLASYVMDAVEDGHWFVQRDMHGGVASKPPLLTWLVSLAVLPTGEITRFALYWPSAFASIAVALILFRTGERMFTWRAGFLAAVTYLVSYAGLRQMEMPRYDGLLSLPVTLAALAAFRGWQTGKGWTVFWFMAAVGTLVKGPLAVLLAAAGLVAAFWERDRSMNLRKGHLPGVILFLTITGGWFVLAHAEMGQPLIDKMIHRELIGHALGGARGGRSLLSLLEPTYNFLRHYGPWSIITLFAFRRLIKRPAENREERRFERFLLGWFTVGLILFSLASHQAGRLILPLLPAAALLTGREMGRWTYLEPRVRLFKLSAGAAAVLLIGTTLNVHLLREYNRGVRQTIASVSLIDDLKSENLNPEGRFPFTYLDQVYTLQICSSTHREAAPAEAVEELLAGKAPAFVVSTRPFPTNQVTKKKLWEVYRWPKEGEAEFRIISNHPRLEWTEKTAQWIGGLAVELWNARIIQGNGKEIVVARNKEDGEVKILNKLDQLQTVTVRVKDRGEDQMRVVNLGPGATAVVAW